MGQSTEGRENTQKHNKHTHIQKHSKSPSLY